MIRTMIITLSILICSLFSFSVFAVPITAEFSADKVSIHKGDVVRLDWNVANAESISISPTVGDVDALSHIYLVPDTTTEYVLIATSPNEADLTQSIVIEVTPKIIFEASSLLISEFGTTQLAWQVRDAENVSISPNIGAVGLQGARPITLTADTTYTLTATSSSGSINTKSLTILIEPIEDFISKKALKLNKYGAYESQEIVEIGAVAIPSLMGELDNVLQLNSNLLSQIESRTPPTATESENENLRGYGAFIHNILSIFSEIKDPASIQKIIDMSIALPQTALAHLDIFRILRTFGNSDISESYAISILNDPNSGTLKLRAALIYLADSDVLNLDAFVTSFLQPQFDIRVREAAVYLGARKGVPNIDSQIVSILSETEPIEWKEFALHALALTATKTELQNITSGVGFTSEQIEVYSNLADYYNASLANKESKLSFLIESRSYIELEEALAYIFSNNRLDLLEFYELIPALSVRNRIEFSISTGLLTGSLEEHLFASDVLEILSSINASLSGTASSPILHK